MVLYKVLALLLLTGVVILSGCTSLEKVYVCQNGTEVASPDLCLSERKNCRELGGYLCGGEGMCALNWMDSTDSYCCPIKCGTCPNNTDLRDDGNSCPADLCSVNYNNGKTFCPPPTVYTSKECGLSPPGEPAVVCPKCPDGSTCTCMGNFACNGDQTFYNDTSYGQLVCCSDGVICAGTTTIATIASDVSGNRQCIPVNDVNFSANAFSIQSQHS